ncbi:MULTISPECIES: cobalamin biosynthesis protein [unclassified Mesorhizobium]|uniref:cobalamin biosynthesis protein n=2 Tax=Mesorhizobium TaxID=68287 RepID=UPI000F74FD1B|nr:MULTISPECIES: cobalamin biosynthesis protein [unclassified Mesorhizobium]AZO02232.1 cobalamin biosynthesis protein [Mesorhizobium sp. M2A.F.Ca.ET.043.02.1.1]RUW34522.1 cobalamin biosynthesis protein [Mesorhizobium sp. M2A.F.Ca.ET.015.02.1.1]RUW66378.1 cobalamin biosynthesis protein [Mesorhizobium sp. M2A.F.Ca.ET.067.02.1.1]RVC95675.1 cobalamin biosynthesis protein [Mesorhizobium sp. M2A.F.Ca.ET.017.03.2.1]RWB46574.1 MAG: cobalamin biosynthesis protein [Mesorhizobium sp.]
MMVAGIGSRKGVSVEEVLAAIETALEAHGLAMTALSALATAPLKKDEAAISAAGRALNLPVVIADDRVLQLASSRTRSRCDLSQSRAGTPSVSEASALAVAGAGARLLGPRTVLGPVTCAIAISGDAP